MPSIDEYLINPMKYFDPRGIFGPETELKWPKASEAREEMERRSHNILSNRKKLKRTWKKHEGWIRKRWMDKDQRQRKAILLTAWPKMAATHRPDFAARLKEGIRLPTEGTRFRDAYLLPHINLEDLLTAHSLPLFIKSRSRFEPYVFAHPDLQSFQFGVACSAIERPFLKGYTTVFEEYQSESYGKLIWWQDEEDGDEAFARLDEGRAYYPGDGLLIMEIQDRILHFLVTCCDLILSDLPDNLPGIDLKTLPPLECDLDPPVVASIAADVPYCIPTEVNFKRLRTVILALRSDSEEHIWNLREDPGYFWGTIQDYNSHQPRDITD